MFVIGVAIVAFWLIYPIFSDKARVEIEGQSIRVIKYVLFVKRERVVQFSQIHKASVEKIYNKYLPPERRFREIVFEDIDRKKLFRVFFTDKSYEFFKDYIVNYDEYLKSIR